MPASSPSPSIRLATADDVPAIVSFVAATLAEFGLTFGTGAATDDQLRGLPSSYAGGAFWVAHAGPTLVGTCGIYPVSPSIFELRKMYVAPSTRGTGLGNQLLALSIDWARAAGGTALVLDTIEAMTRAIAFYEAHGFVRDDTQIRGARCSRGYLKRL